MDPEVVVLQADTVARSRLSGDGDIPVGDLERGLEFDDARHVKDDGAGTLLFDGRPERTGALVVQVRHVDHLAAAAAGHPHAAALGTREGAREAVLLIGRDGEVGIGDRRGRRGGRIRVHGSRGAGIDPGGGGRAVLIHRLHAEAVVRGLGEAGDDDVTVLRGSFLHFRTALLQLPLIGSRILHRVPLEGEAVVGGVVHDQARRGGGERVLRLRRRLVAAAGSQEKHHGEDGQNLSHNFSYSREAQMKGPTPFGSFSTTFSWM